jgi:hypothetical protein
MTRRERDARSVLAAFEAEYVARRSELEGELKEAQAKASTIREGLLYGTGTQLVAAVQSVFETAGITVVDLDQRLGDIKNADLLCSFGGHSRLVEVKSASGSAPERAYQDLARHLREWPNLPGSTPIDGGALVISHELRAAPLERSPRPYTRREFLKAQTEPVIASLDLFAAWREEDADTLRRLLFGPVSDPLVEASAGIASPEPETSAVAGRRRWFPRR